MNKASLAGTACFAIGVWLAQGADALETPQGPLVQQPSIEKQLDAITGSASIHLPADVITGRVELLLDQHPTSETQLRIYKILGERYASESTGGPIPYEHYQKAERYLKLVLDRQGPGEGLATTGNLAYVQEQLHRSRAEIARTLWQGLLSAQAANVPDKPLPDPPGVEVLHTIDNGFIVGDHADPAVVAAKKRIAQEHAERASIEAEYQRRKGINAQVEMKHALEDALGYTYRNAPPAFEELLQVGYEVMPDSDAEYVNSIVKRAEEAYDKRAQEQAADLAKANARIGN